MLFYILPPKHSCFNQKCMEARFRHLKKKYNFVILYNFDTFSVCRYIENISRNNEKMYRNNEILSHSNDLFSCNN